MSRSLRGFAQTASRALINTQHASGIDLSGQNGRRLEGLGVWGSHRMEYQYHLTYGTHIEHTMSCPEFVPLEHVMNCVDDAKSQLHCTSDTSVSYCASLQGRFTS